jgi:hypothetical protein
MSILNINNDLYKFNCTSISPTRAQARYMKIWSVNKLLRFLSTCPEPVPDNSPLHRLGPVPDGVYFVRFLRDVAPFLYN